MTEHNHNHSHNHGHSHDDDQARAEIETRQPLGPGYTYLSNALKVSFVMLQVIMGILIIIFIASGIKKVNYDEQALVLRFGKITGVGEGRIHNPGAVWVWPYPIGEIIKIPVQRKINISLNQFWYYQKPGEEMPESAAEKTYVPPTLNPLIDGYCLVRGEKQSSFVGSSEGSDYNILHSKWVLTYQITNPESFYKNCYVETSKLQAGSSYGDVMEENIKHMLEDLIADAVVRTMVNYTIEEAMYEKSASVTDHVKRLLQEKLDKIESGIRVIDIQRNKISVPRQVEDAFQAAHTAVQQREKAISEAKLYSEKTLSETAGPVANELLAALRSKDVNDRQKELLWVQLAGKAQEQIADSRAYRTKTVESAKANADYLQQILPEYRKHPQLVVQRIYKDAIEKILDNVDEKILIQPGKTSQGKEIRISINRDPTLSRNQNENQNK